MFLTHKDRLILADVRRSLTSAWDHLYPYLGLALAACLFLPGLYLLALAACVCVLCRKLYLLACPLADDLATWSDSFLRDLLPAPTCKTCRPSALDMVFFMTDPTHQPQLDIALSWGDDSLELVAVESSEPSGVDVVGGDDVVTEDDVTEYSPSVVEREVGVEVTASYVHDQCEVSSVWMFECQPSDDPMATHCYDYLPGDGCLVVSVSPDSLEQPLSLDGTETQPVSNTPQEQPAVVEVEQVIPSPQEEKAQQTLTTDDYNLRRELYRASLLAEYKGKPGHGRLRSLVKQTLGTCPTGTVAKLAALLVDHRYPPLA